MGARLVNAVVGAVATLVLAPLLPLSPVVGGGASGYLEARRDGDRADGLWTGVGAGLIAVVVLAAVLVLFGTLFFGFLTGGMGPGPMGPGRFGGFTTVAFLLVAVLGAAYVVGLSGVGGWLGVYLHEEL